MFQAACNLCYKHFKQQEYVIGDGQVNTGTVKPLQSLSRQHEAIAPEVKNHYSFRFEVLGEETLHLWKSKAAKPWYAAFAPCHFHRH